MMAFRKYRFGLALTLSAGVLPLAGAADAQQVEFKYGMQPREDAGAALNRHLKTLSDAPRSLTALKGAGEAALELGDPQAALTFFARAEEVAPRDAQVKAGLGSCFVRMEQGAAALKYFGEAVSLGGRETGFLADRALAYDLVGDPVRAQTDYVAALRHQEDAEVRRNYALSQAIAGNREPALQAIDAQLRRQDRAAWRTRAFILALTGDTAGATEATRAVMPAQAAALAPFFARLPALTPAQRAMAVHFGRFPGDVAVAAHADNSAPTQYARTETSAGRPDAAQAALGQRNPPAAPPSTAPRRRPGTGEAPPKQAPKQTSARMARLAPARQQQAAAKPPVETAAAVPAPAKAASDPAPVRVTRSEAAQTAPAKAAPDPAPMQVTRSEPVQTAPAQTAAPQPRPGFADLATLIQSLPETPSPQIQAKAAPAQPPQAQPAQAQPAQVQPQPAAPAPVKVARAEPLPFGPPTAGTPPTMEDLKEDSTIAPAVELAQAAPAKAAPPKAPPAKEAKATETKAPESKAPEAKAKETKAVAAKKKPEPVAPKEPSRVWVQVAGGANKAALPKEFDRLKDKAPKLLSGKTAWTAPLRATNRLLVGPFKTEKEAQSFVNELTKSGLTGFAWTSPEGQAVVKLASR
ncbi:SPOR domain-containing protein [Sphingomonas sp. LY54]|uniref:SPOR domain-containing protein n=1 Tax=Sphingomonas sp. LY54 TaxID=3095343 RepID=UPI002D79FB8F|nr:SPOR domain-containing protein [Sphingomonas sp. LY54]WRP28068.1 SPOR domain-containing protein [Sphingomonas sp. LY54]